MPETARVLVGVDLTADDRGTIDKFVRTVRGEMSTLAYDLGMDDPPQVRVVEQPDGLDELVAEIASRRLQVGTLEVRNRDSLDFHDCHVGAIADALRDAYEAGRAQAVH